MYIEKTDHALHVPRAAPPHLSAVLLLLELCPHLPVPPHLTTESSAIAPGMKVFGMFETTKCSFCEYVLKLIQTCPIVWGVWLNVGGTCSTTTQDNLQQAKRPKLTLATLHRVLTGHTSKRAG